MEEKHDYRKELFYEQKNGYDRLSAEEVGKVQDYCEGYKAYLDSARTEREAVNEAIAIAEREGFAEYRPGMELKAGDRVWFSNRGKSLMLAVIGKKSAAEGVVIAAAHVDSPRLDLKQLPLYEDSELAYFKTHYYGGIKKYQWTAIPLELHGVVVKKDGEVVERGPPAGGQRPAAAPGGRPDEKVPRRGHPRGEPEHPDWLHAL